MNTPKPSRQENLFFELLHVAAGTRDSLSVTPSPEDWAFLSVAALRQSLVGVTFAAIERLPAEQRPKGETLLRWYAMSETTRQNSRRLNAETVRVMQRLEADGQRAVLLKGQGVALLYPDPLLRMPGDIDVWMSGSRKSVMDYAERTGTVSTNFLHTVLSLSEVTEVEAHFAPSFMYSPVTQRRLRRFFREAAPKEFAHTAILCGTSEPVCTASDAFNRVFLLLHIYRHFFHEGIGLRQMMDYHFLLCRPCSEAERREALSWFRRLKLLRFAGATMFVLQRTFGLADEHLLLPPDEREGRFLLEEIMRSGNFGHFDERLLRARERGLLALTGQRLKRNVRFLRSYPSEVCWSPLFRLWHFCWRRLHGYTGEGE